MRARIAGVGLAAREAARLVGVQGVGVRSRACVRTVPRCDWRFCGPPADEGLLKSRQERSPAAERSDVFGAVDRLGLAQESAHLATIGEQ